MNLQLKRIRKLRGLTQEQMARKLNIKKSRYGTWERGEANMSFPQACDCADILDCTLDELAGRMVEHGYTDPSQEALNGYFESMNDVGRSALIETARLMSDGDSVRIEKDRQEDVSIPSPMEEVA